MTVIPKTKYWPPGSGDAAVAEAAEAIVSGGVVAFPTETVYGLGADARRPEAVRRIFAAKERPADNPLIVHVGRLEDALALARSVSPLEMRLMERFWPGPLTLVLPVRSGAVAPEVTAGLDTVAVRVPDHPLARRLIAKAGCPVAAPSANRSGRPSPTTAMHVLEDMHGRIDGVLDGGPTGIGLESTVVRVKDGVIHILRPGGIDAEMLRECAGEGVEVSEPDLNPSGSEASRPRSPGVKYVHYAPRGEMTLVTGDPARMRQTVQEIVNRKRAEGRKVGVLSCDEHASSYEADAVIPLGPRDVPAEAARNLFAALRECDARELDAIVAEGFPERGIGIALMNRMRKAARGAQLTV